MNNKKALTDNAPDLKKLKKVAMAYFIKKSSQPKTSREMDSELIQWYKSAVLKINLYYYYEFYLHAILYKRSEKEQVALFSKSINKLIRSNFSSGYLLTFYSDLNKYFKELTRRQKKIGEHKKSNQFDFFDNHHSNYTLEIISRELFTILDEYTKFQLSENQMPYTLKKNTVKANSVFFIDKDSLSSFYRNKNLRLERILSSVLAKELKSIEQETKYSDIFELKDHFFLKVIDIIKKRYSPNHYDISWCFIQLLFPGIKVKPDSLKQKQKRRKISSR